MKVIVPCAGRSSRYPNLPPKWMLPSDSGLPMVVRALDLLPVKPEDVIVTVLREHESKFGASEGIRRGLGDAVSVVILEQPTRSQPETVAETLRATGLSEPFLVKDSDNCFALSEIDSEINYVSVASLNDFESINPRNKSYVRVNDNSIITAIREKVVISDLFSVGGYFFRDPSAYLRIYAQLTGENGHFHRELYISDIIGSMILEGIPFAVRPVTRYEDWGTVHEWRRALQRHAVYVVALDGVLFERGSEFFAPHFSDVRPNAMAIEAVKRLVSDGHDVLLLSNRPERLAGATKAQLDAAGLPGLRVMYDVPVARLALVTAPHPTLPFKSGASLEIDPQDENLAEKLALD